MIREYVKESLNEKKGFLLLSGARGSGLSQFTRLVTKWTVEDGKKILYFYQDQKNDKLEISEESREKILFPVSISYDLTDILEIIENAVKENKVDVVVIEDMAAIHNKSLSPWERLNETSERLVVSSMKNNYSVVMSLCVTRPECLRENRVPLSEDLQSLSVLNCSNLAISLAREDSKINYSVIKNKYGESINGAINFSERVVI